MAKIAIVGCNSFTGGYVVDELLAAGHTVLGIDRQEKSKTFLPYLGRRFTNFRFARMDINKHMSEITALLHTQQPEYVMNLAALSEVAPSWEHPQQWYQTNVVALTAIVNGIRTIPSLRNFTQVSTPEVYGSTAKRIREDAPLNPSTPYAASKAAADLSLMTFAKEYAFPVTFTRAANVYGAHQQLFKIIPRAFIYLKMGKTIPLHGGGTAVRSFTHVRDVARAYITIMLKGQPGNVYHISTDTMVQIREIVDMICGLLGKDFSASTQPTPARPGHDTAYTLDASKIANMLGWRPQTPLNEGLREVHDWIESNWAEIRAESLEYIHQP